jgi:hypothetical protein
VEGFNLRKLSELKVMKLYRIKISNRFADWRTHMIARAYKDLGKQREYQNLSHR